MQARLYTTSSPSLRRVAAIADQDFERRGRRARRYRQHSRKRIRVHHMGMFPAEAPERERHFQAAML